VIRPLLRLFRPRLALLNGVAAASGCLLHPEQVNFTTIATAFCGVSLLAAGGSAFNQIMERDLDRLMERTRSRPLPAGDLTIGSALAIGSIVVIAGLMLLVTVGGPLPALIGFAALAWYLGIYTPLKRRTPFALAIGAVCGALPPVIGWCLAGGSPSDFRVMLLAGLLYLWQVPHFWFLQRRHQDEYRRAGVPLFGEYRTGSELTYMSRLWIFALITGAVLLPVFGIIEHHIAFWYAAFPLPLLIMSLLRFETPMFSYLNLFPLMVTVILFIQK